MELFVNLSNQKGKPIYITAKCQCGESLTWFVGVQVEKQVCKFCKCLMYKSFCPHCNELLTTAVYFRTTGELNGETIDFIDYPKKDLPIECPTCKEYLCIDYDNAKQYPPEGSE